MRRVTLLAVALMFSPSCATRRPVASFRVLPAKRIICFDRPTPKILRLRKCSEDTRTSARAGWNYGRR